MFPSHPAVTAGSFPVSYQKWRLLLPDRLQDNAGISSSHASQIVQTISYTDIRHFRIQLPYLNRY
jgi:hypothetical protein